MSYDIYLSDPNTGDPICLGESDPVSVHHLHGGISAVGGTPELWLNVTYNYSTVINRVLDGGIRSLYGTTGEQSTPRLQKAINQLRSNVTDNYWEPTEGNVRRALHDLLTFARLRPDGVWKGD